MSLDFNRLVCAFVGIVFSILWVLVILAFGSAFKLVEITPFEIINGFLISPRLGLCSLLRVFVSSIKSVEGGEFVVLIVLVLGLMIIWSVFAGAVTRLAALEFARGEKTGLKDSLSFVMKKFWSYFWSPLTPILGVLFFVACNVAGGLLGKIEYAGEIAVAVGFPLAILSGFLIVFLGIVGIIGFILMFPAISSEGSDAFDAISRAYSYVLSRPLHFLSLFITIIIFGIILTFVAGYGACLVMQTSYFTVGLGMGDKLNEIRAFIAGLSGAGDTITSLNPMSMRIAALLFMLYIVLIKVTVGSIIIAFAGSASTIAYLILRKAVDGTEINDVYVEEDDEDVVAEETVPETSEEPAVKQASPAPEPVVPPKQKKPETTEESPKKKGLSPKNKE
ncbi:MAG: SPOR domain-containing protein [Candidatus Scalindua sp.]